MQRLTHRFDVTSIAEPERNKRTKEQQPHNPELKVLAELLLRWAAFSLTKSQVKNPTL